MKRALVSLSATALIAAGMFGFTGRASAAHQKATHMSIQIMNPMGPMTVKTNGKITVNVKITGVTLAPKAIGTAPKGNQGHYHFYLDCIPGDAYVKPDLSKCWAGAAATPMAAFDLATSKVKVTRGSHVLLVALSKNNHVLYPAPAAAIVFTAK